jgi:hypothetical protein
VAAFTMIGHRRSGYEWRRHAVSSLAVGGEGWQQRANFILAGTLYCIAADGLRRSTKGAAGPRTVAMLIFGAGCGLIGSGLFVTDPVAGFPVDEKCVADVPGRSAPTRGGRLHNLCAIPIFAGVPAAALVHVGIGGTNEGLWLGHLRGRLGGRDGRCLRSVRGGV